MKKLMSILGSLAIIISAVSCGKKPVESSIPVVSENEVSLMSFKSADIEMAGDFEELICTDRRSAYYLIFGKDENGEYCGYVTNTEFAEKKSFTFTPKDDEEVKCAAMMPAGRAAVLSVMDGHTYIHTFNSNMEPDKEFDLGEVISPDDHFAELLCTDDGFYINIARHDLGFADKDGNYKGELNVKGRTVCGIINDNSGTPCVLLSENMRMTLASLENGDIAEETTCGELSDHTNTICTGDGEYRIAVTVNDGLYALKDDHWVRLCDFSDNDFKLHEIHDMDMTGDGEFTVMLIRESGASEMRLLSQRDISEIRQKRVIRMYSYNSGNMDPYDDRIKKFNSENDEYKLEIVPCQSDGALPAFDKIRMDIISGNAPDIVKFSSEMSVSSFGSSDNIFVDLYDLIDNDSDIKREDFLDGFLEMQETKGRLLQFFPSFGVRSIMIKDKFAGGQTSWSYDGFEAAFRNMPSDMNFSYGAAYEKKYRVFEELMDYGRFIDGQNGECRFDSPEFIRAVRMINDNDIGLSLAQADLADDQMAWVNYEILDFRNDKTLLHPAAINNFHDIKLYEQIYGGGDPCTFIGFPTENGVSAYSYALGGYGIMANSEVIEGAWDFLKAYLIDDPTSTGFSGLKERFEEQLKAESTPKIYTDPTTGEEFNTDIYAIWEDGQDEPIELEILPFTAERSEKYRAMVCEALHHPLVSDKTVENILSEELTACFEGERSAEDAAEIIQNRVSIYLSERS